MSPPDASGWWPFDGNLQDRVTTVSASMTGIETYSTGKVLQAVHFDGASKLRVAGTANTDIGAGSGFTIEGWINPAAMDRPIVEWNDGTLIGMHLWVGQGSLYANLRSGIDDDVLMESAGGLVQLNTWQHVALSFVKATGVATMYVNGSQVAQQTFPGLSPRTTYDLVIGHSIVHDGYFFDGSMDEMTIYPRCLSASELQGVYDAGAAGKCPADTAPQIIQQPQPITTSVGTIQNLNVSVYGSQPLFFQWFFNEAALPTATSATLSFNPITTNHAGNYFVVITNEFGAVTSSVVSVTVSDCVAISSNLVGWWALDNTLMDFVGTNHASVIGGTRFTNGYMDSGLYFDGVANRVVIPASKEMNVGTNEGFTVEGWVKPSNITASRPIFEWNNGSLRGVHFWITIGPVGNLFANIRKASGVDSTIQSAAGIMQTNTWQHVALSYTASSGIATIYLNGQVVAQQNLGSYTPLTTYNLEFGHSILSSSYFVGQMDEMALHKIALTTQEIQNVAGRCKLSIPPQIQSQPQDALVFVGGSTNINVTALGYPLDFHWYFQNALLAGETNATLTLTNVTTNRSGGYFVVVSNAAGMQTSRTALVQVLPLGTPVVNIGGKILSSYQFTNATAQVQIQSTISNATIFYTADGSEPDFSATPYNGSFAVSNSQTIRAVAYDNNFVALKGVPAALSFYYTLTVTSLGGGSVLIAPTNSAYLDSSVVQLTAQPNAQWSFVKWTGHATGTNPVLSVTMNQAKTIQAVFGTTVNTSVTGSGAIRLNPAMSIYPYGTQVQAIAIPDEGSYFALWGAGASGTINPYSLTVTTTAPAISALFSTLPAGRFALTIIPNGKGTAVPAPRANLYTNGQAITVVASPSSGQKFYRWSGEAQGTNNPLSVVMTESKTISADFSGGLYTFDFYSPVITNGQMAFSLLAEPSVPLTVQFSTNLLQWSELGKYTNGANGSFQVIQPISSSKRFYRAVLE